MKHLLNYTAKYSIAFLFCLSSIQFTFAQTTISTSTLTSDQEEEGIMFDVLLKQDATLTGIDAMLQDVGDYEFNIYYRTNTYAGNESSSAGWTLLANTGVVNNAAADAIVSLPLNGATLSLTSGTTLGLYIENIDGGRQDLSMDMGILTGAVAADNSLATLYAGAAINIESGSFSGVNEIDRTFIGTLTFRLDGNLPVQNLPNMSNWYLLLCGILISGLAVYQVYRKV